MPPSEMQTGITRESLEAAAARLQLLGAGEHFKGLQDGAPSRARIFSLPFKWLNSMVYGRYNYSIHGGYNGL